MSVKLVGSELFGLVSLTATDHLGRVSMPSDDDGEQMWYLLDQAATVYLLVDRAPDDPTDVFERADVQQAIEAQRDEWASQAMDRQAPAIVIDRASLRTERVWQAEPGMSPCGESVLLAFEFAPDAISDDGGWTERKAVADAPDDDD